MPGSLSVRSRVVVASFLTQVLIIGGMFSYGVFVSVLESELGWSRTLLSATSSLAFLVMGLLAVVGGRLNDRFGPRWVLSTTAVVTGTGYVLMSGMSEPWQLLLYFGLFVGIGLSTHDVVTLSTVASWFDRRRGIMTGVVKTGAACGQVLMPVFATLLIATVGWRDALLVIGVLIGLVLLLAAQWMKSAPSGASTSISASASTSTPVPAVPLPKPEKTGIPFLQARRSRAMWTLCGLQFCIFPVLMAIPLHIVSHAKDLGMTVATAATVLSLIGGSSILGRVAMGMLFDKIGGRQAFMACLLPLSVSLVFLLMIDQPMWLFVFAPVYGIAHGGLFTLMSPTIAEYFGMRAHGAIFGAILFFGTMGGASGPLVTGLIFDHTGSYELAFLTLLSLVVIGFILTASLKTPQFRVNSIPA